MTRMTERCALAPEQLRRRLDPDTLSFATTADVEPLAAIIGQPRAVDAISFALETPARSHNLFAAGIPGSGRETAVLRAIEDIARTRPVPPDWVYVHNVVQPDQPIAISLPAGQGRALERDMATLVEDIRRDIPRAFEHEDFDRRKQQIFRDATSRRDDVLTAVRTFAKERDYSVEPTPGGFISMALLNGQPIPNDVFEALPESTRKEIEQRGEEVQAQLGAMMRQLRQLEKEANQAIRQLEQDVINATVGPFFEELRDRYSDEQVLAFLTRVQAQIPEHLHAFLPAGSPDGTLSEQLEAARQDALAPYQVNVLIDNSALAGAPIVMERNPTYPNLLGRTDYRAVFGAMVTDFRQIKPGALHRANGGFLVLHALDLFQSPYAWEALKRALITRAITIENIVEQYAALPTARLRPEPIPLDLKVILIGPPEIYQLLYHHDEDFRELFAVRADFAPDMPWSDENIGHYAAFISRQVREHELRHFDRAAVARVAEQGARLREHQQKLSVRLFDIANLITEANYWAGRSGHDPVEAEDVDRAIAQKEYRANLIEERIHEMIAEGTIDIDTGGERIGQVNGLSIADLGDYHFGMPSRVTARSSLGRGSIQSIEREIELSGPIHNKGFLTLSGYLQSQYAQEWPLALGATITFEQAYNEIDGDSASSTELYALLSELAELPIRQGIAVTGAVNQHGAVQAVGGVTRKIEGFYTVCQARGLTGDQGVIIPAANVKHLMLRDEVVEAVRRGDFHIWAVNHIDEGIEILTGVTAGTRTRSGAFRKGSVHARVEDRLRRYAEHALAFAVQNGSNPARTAAK
jgi:lon-related putative ATP-dependent protease